MDLASDRSLELMRIVNEMHGRWDDEEGGMRIGIVAQNIVERIVLSAGFVPVPLVEGFPPLILARALMAAVKLGIFDALATEPLSVQAIAATCGTEHRATGALLAALAGSNYLREQRDADGRYALTPVARKWLLTSSPDSVCDYLRFNELQWDWLGGLEQFIVTGQPVRFHETLTAEQWDLYQRGMRSIARLTAPEVARRVPVPRAARALLDIGGGHGVYATAIARRHTGLTATVLDLPPAVAAAQALCPPASLRFIAGDALTADLGEEIYDTIFVANLVHHFDATTNQALAHRVARALRPGGTFIIQDGVRTRHTRTMRQFGALGELFFTLTSDAGVWSFGEMAAWQREAGLMPQRSIALLTAPSQGLQVATKR